MRPHRSLILVAALISSAQAFTVATAPIAGPGAKPLKTCLGSLGHRRSVVSQAAKLGLCVALALGSPPNAEAKIASSPQSSVYSTSRTTKLTKQRAGGKIRDQSGAKCGAVLTSKQRMTLCSLREWA